MADGEPLDLASCASEPIHIPSLIQPHGALLALDPATLLIEQVSANSEVVLGVAPLGLIGNSPATFLGEHQFERLAASAGARPFELGVSSVTAGARQERMECISSRYRGSLILEFQPTNGVHSLEPIDVSIALQAPLSRMERTASVDDLVSTVAKEIRAINGYDRVMVYQFDEDWHGTVLAEDAGERLPVAYLGLHFPATDIPAQARELYLLNTLRLIPDAHYAPVPIVPAENPRLHAPLDLSRSDLRSVSPIHLEYLRNIGVRATLTISIVVHGKLWGLIACHHDSPRRLSHAARSTCNFFAQMLALKLSARIDHAVLAQRLAASERIVSFVADLEPTQSLWDALHRSWASLLPIFEADALFVRGPEGRVLYGASLPVENLSNSLALLATTAVDGVASSTSLCRVDPAAQRFATDVSGALSIGLSDSDDTCLVLLRREESATVRWAGDPHKPALAEAGKGRLSPRASFATWEEIKRCESSRWNETDLRNAASLRDQLMHWARAGEEVRQLAYYDALTELPNRRLLEELLQRALSEATARHMLVGVLFIDVDRFKRFNDRLGHAAGDRVLRHVATRITRAVRDGDIVGRLGGDEFVVVMPSLSDSRAVDVIAQRLLDEIPQRMTGIEGDDLRVTLSIGISMFPSDGTTGETLLSRADAAMYRAKASGRSASRSYEVAPGSFASNASQQKNAVSDALDRGEIIAHYQPIVSLTDGSVVAVEALARWNHPTSGILPPSAFIPAAEESDVIVRLGETVLDLACEQLARWRHASAAQVRIVVNVSPRQLRAAGFRETIQRVLARHGLPAEALELDITEAMVAGDNSPGIQALRELAGAGVRVTLDDFGTGYSSFASLRKLPITSLKIDRSFTAELGAPETLASGAAIIRGMIAMAKSLGLQAACEGVETAAQLELLRREGCDFAQGFYICRPLSAAAYTTFSQAATGVA